MAYYPIFTIFFDEKAQPEPYIQNKLQTYNRFLMKIFFITVLLCQVIIQTAAQTPILISDPSTTSITFPANRIVDYSVFHNTNNPNFTGIPGASWIYITGRNLWPNNFRVIFQSLFAVDCPQVVAQLRITADNNFTAFLNGVLVGRGNNWQRVYLFNVALRCGRNNLTVVTFNTNANTPAALIFGLLQNQSTCYMCASNPSAFYNRNTCRCQCTNTCNCSSNLQRFLAYPYCGCVCAAISTCPVSSYFNSNRCSC